MNPTNISTQDQLDAPPLEPVSIDRRLDEISTELSALIHDYFAMVERYERIVPIRLHENTPPTEVLAFVSGLLRGSNIELFELGMWQTWSGLKR
jgi:hypothetical protein